MFLYFMPPRGSFYTTKTLTGLAILEHWFMVVPMPVKALWEWGMGSGSRTAIEPSEITAHHCAANALDQLPEPIDTSFGAVDSSAKPRPIDRNQPQEDQYLVAADGVISGTHVLPRPLLATIWRLP